MQILNDLIKAIKSINDEIRAIDPSLLGGSGGIALKTNFDDYDCFKATIDGTGLPSSLFYIVDYNFVDDELCSKYSDKLDDELQAKLAKLTYSYDTALKLAIACESGIVLDELDGSGDGMHYGALLVFNRLDERAELDELRQLYVSLPNASDDVKTAIEQRIANYYI